MEVSAGFRAEACPAREGVRYPVGEAPLYGLDRGVVNWSGEKLDVGSFNKAAAFQELGCRAGGIDPGLGGEWPDSGGTRGGVGIASVHPAELAAAASAWFSIDASAMFQRHCDTGSPKGFASIDTLDILEDVPKGLVLLESIGRLVGKRIPTAAMLIDLATAYTRKDIWAGGSTLDSLGIDGWSQEAVLHWLETAECPHDSSSNECKEPIT